MRCCKKNPRRRGDVLRNNFVLIILSVDYISVKFPGDVDLTYILQNQIS